jgi:hypothetical protein
MGKFLLTFAFVPAVLFGQNPPAPAPASSATIAPLSVPEKFESRIISTFGPTKLVVIGLVAGYDQITNTPSEWRQGAEGYGKRYASEFGTQAARQMFAFTLETTLHQDPRYFPSGEKGFGRRFKSVIKQTFVARRDSGSDQFAYARIGSALGASFLANTWQPKSTDTVGNAMTTFGVTIGGDAAYNFLQEFIPRFRPKELRNQ